MQSNAASKASASIEDDEKKQRIPNPKTTPERGRGWVRTRDIESPRIHRNRMSPKKDLFVEIVFLFCVLVLG